MNIFLQPTSSKALADCIMVSSDVVPRSGEHVFVEGYKGQANGRFEVLQVQHIFTVIARHAVEHVNLIVREVK